MKVTHLTSVHPRYDTRIFVKMCTSLANAGYVTSLIVADGLGNEKKNNVNIVDVGVSKGGRLKRMTQTVKRVYEQAKLENSSIYHIHDPELMQVALKLKRLGKKVIFDAHEDLPKQILGKPYLNSLLKRPLAKAASIYESFICSKLDAVVAATPYIREKFLKVNIKTIDINNFPLLTEFSEGAKWDDRKNDAIYIGGITKIRGINEIVLALKHTDGVRLNLAGNFSEPELEQQVKGLDEWESVNSLGFIGRDEVNAILGLSKVGLVTLHPTVNYVDALPVKMFEYMAAGIPVVASNFPLWKEIVEKSDCGICVDPLNIKEIGKAIQSLIDDPEEAQRKGHNGRVAAENIYNWRREEGKLISLYESITN